MSLAGEDLAEPEGAILLKVSSCSECGDEAPIVVTVVQVIPKGKKEEKKNLTAPLVYPGSYVEYVQAIGHEAPGIIS